jgi:stearoyl-CoA desaturase (delta-9 desaturase)
MTMSDTPRKAIDWRNTLFLTGTLLITLTAVPAYLWHFGLQPFQVALFLLFFAATGLSVTLGYHRLFTHRSFQAPWPIRLITLLFGAAAFENSVLCWAADHRRHHKFTDHENDPYDISKGLFHAHIGWILFKTAEPVPFDQVKDLQRDVLVRWQHKYYVFIAVLMGFGLPALLGGLFAGPIGALGGFLIAGIARTVFVQHMTFLINSLCHTIGRQTYSARCSARDSALLALFTFGEGYHNFHHAFQHDYRNGIKPWHFDPTKWTIWLLHKLGLARDLRRVPQERVLLAEVAEKQRRLAEQLNLESIPLAESIRQRLHATQLRLQEAFQHWEEREAAYALELDRRIEVSREKIRELKRDFIEARNQFRAAFREWKATHQLVLDQFTLQTAPAPNG